MQIDFYNTSSLETKMLREIGLLVITENKKSLNFKIKSKISKDNSEELFSIINLKPKQVLGFDLVCRVDKNLDKVLNGKWYIKFKKGNKRIGKVKISNVITGYNTASTVMGKVKKQLPIR